MSTESNELEERRSLLELVAAGKMSVADAAERIAALGSRHPASGQSDATTEEPAAIELSEAEVEPESATSPLKGGSGEKGRWLHVHVSDIASGKSRVRIQLPLSFLNFGLKIGGRFAPELEQLNLKDLAEDLNSMEKGILVDVADEDGGEHVRIFVD
jgi:hypothetical protein